MEKIPLNSLASIPFSRCSLLLFFRAKCWFRVLTHALTHRSYVLTKYDRTWPPIFYFQGSYINISVRNSWSSVITLMNDEKRPSKLTLKSDVLSCAASYIAWSQNKNVNFFFLKSIYNGKRPRRKFHFKISDVFILSKTCTTFLSAEVIRTNSILKMIVLWFIVVNLFQNTR